MAEVKINLPGVETGADVEVLHLGVFPNGQTSEVTDEQISVWEAQTDKTYPEDGLDLPEVTSEPEQDPTAEPETEEDTVVEDEPKQDEPVKYGTPVVPENKDGE